MSSVASAIKSFLHFSVPDEGPLTDYESWMPDFMHGLAKGIDKSKGAVNKKTGIIGGSSAIPYIHNFKIVDELEKRFGLPVSIENDANSAALGELAEGSGKGCED